MALVLLAGCDAKPTEPPPARHGHQAPHGGTLLSLGEDFAHVELVLDSQTGQLSAFVLDGEAEKSIRLVQEEISVSIGDPSGAISVVLRGVASPLTGEKIGDTSQFEGRSERLRGRKEFEGTLLRLVVQGRDFAGIAFQFPRGNEGLK